MGDFEAPAAEASVPPVTARVATEKVATETRPTRTDRARSELNNRGMKAPPYYEHFTAVTEDTKITDWRNPKRPRPRARSGPSRAQHLRIDHVTSRHDPN